jgi:hypothetical protein
LYGISTFVDCGVAKKQPLSKEGEKNEENFLEKFLDI